MTRLLAKAQARRRLIRPGPESAELQTVWQKSSGDLPEHVPVGKLQRRHASALVPSLLTPRLATSRCRLEKTSEVGIPHHLRGRETVLVVDKSPLMREAIAANLRLLGYRVLEAAGAREAQYHSHAERKIHLAVIDVPTPDIRHFELAQWFRAIYPDTRLLLATDWLWGLNLDLDSQRRMIVLAKPFTPLDLARMVRLVLNEVNSDDTFHRR